ncbi:MAG: ABC transporter substrate-binding protein [Zoogloeaceae bacterium]|jgi:ABC-type nitrate/sulfonate/bicarbonate transport system substrate-binding protein|nr:ABC transporter substrate-binding protein [Zoogloeaceae bacterium]
MKSRRFLLFATLALTLLFTACDKGNDAPPPDSASPGTALEKLEFRYLNMGGYVDILELAEDLGYLAPVKLKNVGMVAGGPQGIQVLLSGDSDCAISFTGAIIKVAVSGAPVTAVIAAFGYDTEDDTFFGKSGFYVREESDIHGPRDLIGKKIAINTLGAQAELVLREYMARGGLRKEEIDQVEFLVIPPGSMEQVLRQQQVDVAQSGGIGFNQGVRRLFRTEDVYRNFTAGAYVMSNHYLRENPNTSRHVISAMSRAIKWAKATPRAEVLARLRQINIKRGRSENNAIIDVWTGYGIVSPSGALKDEDFQIWIDWYIRDGQFKASDVDLKKLYTNAFNAHAQPVAQE